MNPVKIAFAIAGLALLWLVLKSVNLDEVIYWTIELGWLGLTAVLAVYAAAFFCDVASWQLAFKTLHPGGKWRWLYRLYLVRLAGEAFNNIIPSASLGGEPVKAVILKSRYRISYRETGASLIIARTVNMLGLVLFLAAGFLLLLASPLFTDAYKLTAGTGLVLIAAGTVLFYLVQRFQFTSLAGVWATSRKFLPRMDNLLRIINDVDAHLAGFYSGSHAGFGAALALAIGNWLLGVVEIWVIFRLLGIPASFTDCWIIEAMAQLVRTGTFFIPASIGAQEGIFLLTGAAVTGNPSLGVALSIIRRIRELIWICLGLAVWAWIPVRLAGGDHKPAGMTS